ncbi:hypothetical protein HYV88_05135 [Candidatus Woesearchaeota archaeon]|nr:hypothetical protein [Candidatus Woesearchaeota archaeon]
MPISVKELYKAGKGFAKFKDFLRDFLVNHPDFAYTIQELADESLKLEEWSSKYSSRRRYLEQLIRNYLIDLVREGSIVKFKGRYHKK